jgi:hypothetical protein
MQLLGLLKLAWIAAESQIARHAGKWQRGRPGRPSQNGRDSEYSQVPKPLCTHGALTAIFPSGL